jgi:hypothetical protein
VRSGTIPAQRREPAAAIIGGMEEARRVLARLERIAALDRERTPPGELLAELRALLSEAEAWTRAEQQVPDGALEAVERCRLMLQGTSRTLLA